MTSASSISAWLGAAAKTMRTVPPADSRRRRSAAMSAAADLPISLRVGNVKAGRASRGDAVWLGLDALMLSGLVGLDGLVPDASWLDDFELEEGIKRLQATGRSATFIVRA